MKKTVAIDESLHRRAKRRAVDENITLEKLVDQAVTARLTKPKK